MSDGETKRSESARREEEMLAFWSEHKIFAKSLQKEAPQGEFIFYDGPPFANGLPHYGHILASTIKDAIPRYKTMRGYRVARRWGWDCHGLPVENLVEKELGFKTKREIEQFGVAKFNAAARKSIMKDVDAWKRIVPRLGRWADMENDYKTMDATYTESVWWAFKKLHEQGLVEKSFKAMHLCSHCGTTLSNFEVSQGYKDIQDIAVTVKLELAYEPGTYLLAWTTTPWTLPGNMAAAVNPDVAYVEVEAPGGKYILAKERLHVLSEARVLRELQTGELIGKHYKPPFPYYLERDIPNKENAWKVYAADYVDAESGTGIVHLAPAYGEEDLALARANNIPIVHHVDKEGKFEAEIEDFAGLSVKPKDDHQRADIEILKYLVKHDLLFAKEKVTHSYPHCWRCDTPLLNYAATSWFVKVPALRDQLVSENKRITWVPPSIGEFRFGNWLENARDWAISRSRFWGAPLPVWEAEDGSQLFIGSKADLVSHMKTSGNRYFLMRHGEAESNVSGVLNSDNSTPNHLTELGRKEAAHAARTLPEKPAIVYASPLTRAQETAEIAAKELGISKDSVITDSRLAEVQFGVYNGKSRLEYHGQFNNAEEYFTKRVDGAETWVDVRRRVGEFLYEIEAKHQDTPILIVTHDAPALLMNALAEGEGARELSARVEYDTGKFFMDQNVSRVLPFVPLPHNENYELDYHRPYIDEIVLVKDGKEYRRVSDVFDCWFESGSMSFAQHRYPFEKTNFDPYPGWLKSPKGFPADFIAEGLDQTRGWFYSLLVLGVALFGETPYENVIVNGLVLAEDGQKMSKRLKNYPDPMEVVDASGADAMRLYMLSSPVVRGEDLNFSARGVQEVASKNIGRLANVLSFYELYTDGTNRDMNSTHVLDRWILARLEEFVRESSAGYERYELDRATRPMMQFVDDLSAWYLRRSRDRLKEEGSDKKNALATLRHVLFVLSRAIAPATPFFAEYLYRAVREERDPESVHLAEWPRDAEIRPDPMIITAMLAARAIVTRALEEREKASIRVRQPLSLLSIPKNEMSRLYINPEIEALIAEEVNVKKVEQSASVPTGTVKLDTMLTPELREEGFVRELIRAIQSARKDAGLNPEDTARISLGIEEVGRLIVEKYFDTLKAGTRSDIEVASADGDERVGAYAVSIRIKR